MKNNEKGIGAIQVLLVLGLVIIIGFVGWYVWYTQSIARNAQTTAATATKPYVTTSPKGNQNPTVPIAKSSLFKVPELGIQIINIPSSLSDLNYAVNVNGTQPNATYAYFSTISLSNLDKSCSPTGHVSENGALSVSKGTYNSATDLQGNSPDQFVKQMKGFWISYGHPQAACSNSATTEALHVTQTKAFRDLVSNPANIETLQAK